MAIKTNLKSLTPRRQQYKKEITLLSKGFNDPAWAGGKLTIYPWDNTIDQWIVDNLRKLSRQDLIFGLLGQVADLNGGKLDNFVADEINVVLLVSRALTTDGAVVYTAQCPYCGSKTEETIKVPDELGKIGEKAVGYPGYDTVTLPDVKDVVKLRPLLIADEKVIIGQRANRDAVPDGELRTILRIVEINDSKPDNLDEMIQWFRALSPRDCKFLDDEGRKITPHLDTNIPHKCDEAACGRSFTFPLSFDSEFFR
jgi:hypothetical protein